MKMLTKPQLRQSQYLADEMWIKPQGCFLIVSTDAAVAERMLYVAGWNMQQRAFKWYNRPMSWLTGREVREWLPERLRLYAGGRAYAFDDSVVPDRLRFDRIVIDDVANLAEGMLSHYAGLLTRDGMIHNWSIGMDD